MSCFWEDIGLPITIAITGILLLIAAVIGAGLSADAWSCRGYQRVTGLPTRYEATTCYVQENGRWLSYDERKLRNATVGQ